MFKGYEKFVAALLGTIGVGVATFTNTPVDQATAWINPAIALLGALGVMFIPNSQDK